MAGAYLSTMAKTKRKLLKDPVVKVNVPQVHRDEIKGWPAKIGHEGSEYEEDTEQPTLYGALEHFHTWATKEAINLHNAHLNSRCPQLRPTTMMIAAIENAIALSSQLHDELSIIEGFLNAD